MGDWSDDEKSSKPAPATSGGNYGSNDNDGNDWGDSQANSNSYGDSSSFQRDGDRGGRGGGNRGRGRGGRGGFNRDREGGDFKPRNYDNNGEDGGFKPRRRDNDGEGGFRQRRDDNGEGGFRQRRDNDGEGGFRPRRNDNGEDGGEFRPRRRDNEGGEDGNTEEKKRVELYIPPEPSNDENEIFGASISAGINFDKFDKINVQVSGDGCEKFAPVDTFQDAGLREYLLENIRKSGYTKPTPIQKRAIPIIMAKRDLMGCAQTGSGKK